MSRESEDLQLWRALGNTVDGGQSVAEVRIRHLAAKRTRTGPLSDRERQELSALMAHLSVRNNHGVISP